MKTRSIVSAIVAAALSVVLCVGLLVGTTVAWFTDTVSSTGNSITAGALAVELNDGSSEAFDIVIEMPGTVGDEYQNCRYLRPVRDGDADGRFDHHFCG